jgi:hypothetical protein
MTVPVRCRRNRANDRWRAPIPQQSLYRWSGSPRTPSHPRCRSIDDLDGDAAPLSASDVPREDASRREDRAFSFLTPWRTPDRQDTSKEVCPVLSGLVLERAGQKRTNVVFCPVLSVVMPYAAKQGHSLRRHRHRRAPSLALGGMPSVARPPCRHRRCGCRAACVHRARARWPRP